MENYEILGTIGEGTYGIVLKARQKESAAVVALKKFKESDEDEQVRKTALREVRILKQLKHDNIVSLIEVFRRKGKLYLVFEYMESTVLEELEKNPNGVEPVECKKMIFQLLQSIAYCHANNIIHRDIKPENLLVSSHGILKLCDFGFARPLGGPGARYTDYVATRWYRSPELLAGDTQYGRGVDIWAIGCMLAEIYTGMPLFPGESDIDQLFQIVRCQGNLTDHLCKCLRSNPLFEGVQVPHVTEAETLKRRLPHFDSGMIAFMSACLGMDPSRRASCLHLLEMEYFRGFHEWWAQEFKRLAEKDLVGYRGRFRKRTKKPAQGVHASDTRSDINEGDTDARKRLDYQRKSMDDDRQTQLANIKASLDIPAFNPNKNKKEKERERRERREREEHDRREAETRREAREKKERDRRERDDRDRERRERAWDDRESRRPSKDNDVAKHQDTEGRLIGDCNHAGNDSAFLVEPHRSAGPTSLQKFNEEENGTGEIGHLPNLRMSTPVAPALLAFPQLLVEDSDAVSHVSEAMRAEGSQRRATSRQGMRSDVEGARHDAFVSKTNRDLDVTGAVGKRDDTGSKGRKKKPAAVADRFSASERFGFSSRYGIDPTQYKQHHVGELGNVGTRERGERDDLGMGSWSGHTLRDVPRSKPAVAVAKSRGKKNLPAMGGHSIHSSSTHIEPYTSFGAKPLPQTMRGDHRGDTKHKNTFDVYKPKTPNLEKRPPVTPNFEPFGRRERVESSIPAARMGTPNYEQYGRPNFDLLAVKYRSPPAQMTQHPMHGRSNEKYDMWARGGGK